MLRENPDNFKLDAQLQCSSRTGTTVHREHVLADFCNILENLMMQPWADVCLQRLV